MENGHMLPKGIFYRSTAISPADNSDKIVLVRCLALHSERSTTVALKRLIWLISGGSSGWVWLISG